MTVSPSLPLAYACRTCAATEGNACPDPVTGKDAMPHQARLDLAIARNLATWETPA